VKKEQTMGHQTGTRMIYQATDRSQLGHHPVSSSPPKSTSVRRTIRFASAMRDQVRRTIPPAEPGGLGKLGLLIYKSLQLRPLIKGHMAVVLPLLRYIWAYKLPHKRV